ncbi:S-layer homology domain-containing protein [Paenibacillus sp. ACRSA]|uniref:S-layer homology domain-containing protein n=1 Tax=Paenibacillus sp. ACRSA TaxID=2918211 RepID=UPI001EF3D6DF|nr:S-layer homology domain-containing protein [Paenibacillus sp. ACRSA]MCG7376531.1 S-layer homology domain-containing protein [Paenibacillus sp. ACRSA]
MAKLNKRVKKQAEQLTKVVLAFALLSPHALMYEIGSTAVMVEAVETIQIESDTSMKAGQSSKVKVEMNSVSKYSTYSYRNRLREESRIGQPNTTTHQKGTEILNVNEKDWFAPEIEAAIRQDMVHGMGNGRFAPHALVTREQASKIIANVVRSLNSESSTEPKSGRNAFTDQVNVSHWATEEVKELAYTY